MKTILFCIISFLMLVLTEITFADQVVTTTTTEEVGIPIVVTKGTYTYATPDYYYYSGHRCFTRERPDISPNFIGLRANIEGIETRIYCYPYP